MHTRLVSTALAVTMLSGAAAAETPWREFNALKLYENDEVDADASVFSAQGHFLVHPSDSELWFVLSPREYTVHSLEADAASAVDVTEKDSFTLVGVLDKEGATLSWEADEERYTLSAKPPLLGAITLTELRAHTSKYDADIEAYEPDAAAVSALAAVSQPTTIVVGFGTWCPICAEWLPRFLKALEAADNDQISLTLISINEDLDYPADLLEANGIDGVPTFVVKRGDRELGRITQDWLDQEPDAVIEKRIVEILGSS